MVQNNGVYAGTCIWCKESKYLTFEPLYEYYDAELDMDITGPVVRCTNCDALHFSNGGFQIDAKPKEFTENIESYITQS